MTIDEAIKDFKSTQVDPLSSRCNAVFNIVCKIIDEWQWYRSQNLIYRESARRAYHDVIGTMWYTSSNTVDEMIDKLPKAEPPHHIGEVTEMVNGDCETCKHYIEQQRLSYDCQECIEMGMKDYEPYIPKDNE